MTKHSLLRIGFCLTAFMMLSTYAWAKHDHFKVSVYVRAAEVQKMKDTQWLESSWATISNQLDVDKIYLETHRDLLIVDDATIEKAKKFFQKQGIEVAGGITYTINESNEFETFCYSDPEHRKLVQKIAETTACHFDEFLLDDFFFTSCKSQVEVAAKGKMSWTDYRLQLMNDAAKNLVLGPAKAVNLKVKVIIKYPNWYDHFQGLGFNLEDGPKLFDGIWTGTETRDPASAQHLQNYLSYNIIRYFENLLGTAFLFQAVRGMQQYLLERGADITDEELLAIPVPHCLKGEDQVGILFWDTKERLYWVKNVVANQTTWKRYGTNAVCWQTATGAWIAYRLLDAVSTDHPHTMAELSLLMPEKIDALLKQIGLTFETEEQPFCIDEFKRNFMRYF